MRISSDFAIIDAELRLQVRHVVRQLAAIFGAEIPSAENENAGEAAQKQRQLSDFSGVIRQLEIRELIADF